MIDLRCECFAVLDKAIKLHQIYGENIPIYLNKIDSSLTKDRVAASFITDPAFRVSSNGYNTLIKALNINDNTEKLFKSDKALNYDSLMAMIYELRLNGYVVTAIANISLEDNNQITCISELHTDTNIIRISMSDELRNLTKTIIKEHEYRSQERHVVKIMRISALNRKKITDKIIKIAIKSSFDNLIIYDIESNTNEHYKVYEGVKLTCVRQGNDLLFVSTKKDIDISKFELNLRSLLSQENRLFNIEVSNEIIMF